MTKPSLVDAATKLEDELATYEKLTDEVGGAAVHSEKTLARATRAMQEAASCHERIMEHVGVMAEVMGDTRIRQQACAERLVAAGQRLSARATVFQELLAQYEVAGTLSKALNARATEIATQRKAGEAVGDAVHELLERIEEAIAHLAKLLQSAKDEGFVDLTRDAESFKQQLVAAHNHLKLVDRAQQPS